MIPGGIGVSYYKIARGWDDEFLAGIRVRTTLATSGLTADDNTDVVYHLQLYWNSFHAIS